MERIIIGEKQKKCDYRKTCYGFAMQGNKLLLSYNSIAGEYSLPGGGVEPNEMLNECLMREFAEEVGFSILETREFINIDCFWRKRDGRFMETDANFLFVRVDLDNNFAPTEEFHNFVWVEKKDALNMINFPYQRKAIEIFSDEYDKIDFKFN